MKIVQIIETNVYGVKAYHCKCQECGWVSRRKNKEASAVTDANKHHCRSNPIPEETTMKTETEWKRASEVATVKIGDRIVTACGIEVTVTDIYVQDIRRSGVRVAYFWNDNGNKGTDIDTLESFHYFINS